MIDKCNETWKESTLYFPLSLPFLERTYLTSGMSKYLNNGDQ